MEHRSQVYRALSKVWASSKWIAKSNKNRHMQRHWHNKDEDEDEGEVIVNHTYGANGHIRLAKRMVSLSYSNLLTIEISLNSYIWRLKLGLSDTNRCLYARA
jgi:hypothetical protein